MPAKKKSTAKKSSAKKAPAKKAAAKKAPAKKAAAKKAPAKKAAARKPNAAFMKAMTPSPELAAVVGNKPMPRTEITKKLWVYIKKNNLQDPKERRMINADDNLRGCIQRQETGVDVRHDEACQQAPQGLIRR